MERIPSKVDELAQSLVILMLACKQTPPNPWEVQPTSRYVKVKAGGDEQPSYSELHSLKWSSWALQDTYYWFHPAYTGTVCSVCVIFS